MEKAKRARKAETPKTAKPSPKVERAAILSRPACQVVLGDGREIGERDGIRLDTANKLCRSVSNSDDEAAEGFFDEVPGMLEAFGSDAKRFHLLTYTTEEGVSPPQFGASHFQARRNRYG